MPVRAMLPGDYLPGPRGFPPSPNGLRLSGDGGEAAGVRCSRGLGGDFIAGLVAS